MLKTAQRGFVHSRLLDLVFLFVLILLGIGLWQWLSTVVSGDFMLAWVLVWLMAASAAGWWTRDQPLVLRIPAGFLLFLLLGALLGPLSWWSGNKFAAAAEAAVLAVGVRYVGGLWSGRLKRTLAAGFSPWYLDQSISLTADLGRWIGICILAWFVVGVLPLLAVFILPPEWIPWAALLWAFGVTAFCLYKYRPARLRLFTLPTGLYAFVLTAVLLRVFQIEIAGAMEAGSFELVAYVAYWPVVVAGFVEVVVLGTKKPPGSKV